MKICIYPDLGDFNYYIKNIINILGDKVEFVSFRDLMKRPLLFFEIDYFFLNWFENQVVKNEKILWLEFFLKKTFISISKILGKKIIWTFHNKLPHDCKNKKQINNIMKFLMKYSDKIIIHCKETYDYINMDENKIKEKVVYIPHGNYIGNYRESDEDFREVYGIDTNEMVFMFLGQVKRYKNIELLMEAFNECNFNNAKLIIVGNCKSEEYKQELIKLKNNDSIIFDFKFIPDEDMVKYLNTTDIVVLPYDMRSSLNSGSIIMTFSLNKTLIAPNIGTLKDINEDFYFSYDYEDNQEHKYQLIKSMKLANDLYNTNKICLNKKGEKAYQYVRDRYSWEKIKEIYINKILN